ncbi:MAG: hypothetical protein PWR10_1164 [Halanaerobiales bacterium]|nr:hypothetical protein [Halanaerobiales bacterium]
MGKMIPDEVDLVLIDGALDRRSSAMPGLADGIILATGAVIGNTEDLVVKRTMAEIEKLTLPEVKEAGLRKATKEAYLAGNGGIVLQDGNVLPFKTGTFFGNINEIKKVKPEEVKAIILGGALVNGFVDKLIQYTDIKNCYLIVRDGTRVFLDKRKLNLLEKRRIKLQVYNPINLIAVTVNPVSPYGVCLNSCKLVCRLRKELKDIPVYDIMSEEYFH